MTETSQRYARLADAFAAKIAAVPDDRWACPSPCEGWTARDVVRHVIDSQEINTQSGMRRAVIRTSGRLMPSTPRL